MRQTKEPKVQAEEYAREKLTGLFPPGGTVWIDIHYYRGMTRTCRVLAADTGRTRLHTGAGYEETQAPRVMDITRHVAALTGYRVNKSGLLSVGGCGFSLGGAIADDLTRVLREIDPVWQEADRPQLQYVEF